jgi:chromosome segregation ATPase
MSEQALDRPQIRLAVARPSGEAREATNMEEQSPPCAPEDRWSIDFSRALRAQRDQANDFVESHREGLDRLQIAATAQVQAVGDELRRQQQANLAELEELERQRAELDQRRRQVEAMERAAAEKQAVEAEQAEQLAAGRQRLQDQMAHLERLRDESDGERGRTKSQRRRIVGQLLSRRADQLEWLNRERAQLASQLQALEAAQQSRGARESEQAERTALGQELADQRARSESLERKLEEVNAQRAALETEVRNVTDQLSKVSTGAEGFDALLRERNNLEERLTLATERLAQAEQENDRPADSDVASHAEELKDMHRRYELAMEDLRELKKRNKELERGASAPAPTGGGAGLDWEAQKRRMLDSLEEHDQGSHEGRLDRSEIEDIVRRMEAAIAAKDVENVQLKGLLEAQAHASVATASATAARG